MKLKVFGLLPLLAVILSVWGPVQPGCRSLRPASHSCSDSDVRHCTVVTVSQGSQVFFGGNDDYINRDSTYWVDPGSNDRYGAIYFGEPDNIQQGFNEKGLAYDANGLARAPVTSHPGSKPVYGGYSSYPIQILQECATVKEVIAWVQEHQWHEVMHDQLHFADATGDAVVISAGPDGKVAFTRKPTGDGFLISTNFNLANPSSGGYPCWRYSRAEKMLRQIQGQDELTVERVASIMNAVHVEGPSGWTLYSLVADLRQRLVYVYFMFQYDSPIVLSIDEELANPQASGPMSELFPEETRRRAGQAYQQLMARSTRCDIVGLAWLGLVAMSLVALLRLARSKRQGLGFWIPIVAVLGPVGLLVWLAARRGRGRRALVETVGTMPACVVGMVAAMLAVILVPAISQNDRLKLLAFYGLPLTLGLFVYQSPLLARSTGSPYLRTVVRRLPALLVSTNLALAGLLAIDLPLLTWHAGFCGISILAILSWEFIAVLGAVGGGLLLYPYQAWAVRRGYATWSALLSDTGVSGEGSATVSFPPWGRLWIWIPFSLAALVGGLALGVWLRV